MGKVRQVTMPLGEAQNFLRNPEKRPVPIPCEYCSRASLVMQSNCDGCGAGLPTPKTALLYDPSIVEKDALMNIYQPGRNIPIDLSAPQHNSKLSD